MRHTTQYLINCIVKNGESMAVELTLRRLLTPEGQNHFKKLYTDRDFTAIAEFIYNIEPDLNIPMMQHAVMLSRQYNWQSEDAQAIHFLSNHARFALTQLQPSSQAIQTARHHDENFPVWPLAALHAFYSNIESFERRFAEGSSHKTAEGNPQLVFVPAPVIEAAFCQQYALEQDFTFNSRHNLLAHILPRNGITDKEEVLGAVHYAVHDTFPVNDAQRGLQSRIVISGAEIIKQAMQIEREELEPRGLLTAGYQRPTDEEFLKAWVEAIRDACYWLGALGDNYNARLMDKEGRDVLLVPLNPEKYMQDRQLLVNIAESSVKNFNIK
jgi:hypothetical protein